MNPKIVHTILNPCQTDPESDHYSRLMKDIITTTHIKTDFPNYIDEGEQEGTRTALENEDFRMSATSFLSDAEQN